MQRYDFEVLKGDQTIAAERSIMLHNTKAAWPRITKLANAVHTPGCLIRVNSSWDGGKIACNNYLLREPRFVDLARSEVYANLLDQDV
jgi:hypothetical protein